MGNLAGSIYGHILNRSELESSTSRISTMVRNLHTGILVEDENRKIVLVNNEFCHLFNIPVDPERLVGIDYSTALEQINHFFKEPKKFSKRINKILSVRQPAVDEQLELINGCVYERDYLPIYSGVKFMGHLWRYSDITQRKKAETELKKARHEAISANIAKRQFLANMSHEIRNPLHAINGLTRLLEDTLRTDEQKKLINGLNKSSEGLLEIVNDILDFSKIEAGQMNLYETGFSLEELVKKIFDAFEFWAEEREVKLKNKFDKEIRFHLFGDNIRLRQVLVNLMNNAIKFTEKGNVTVECSLVKSNRSSCIIFFKVSDTGIGITKDNIAKIFQSFQQEDTGTTRSYGGTGLGLAISKQLVNLLGGELEVKSRKNKGSEFFFSLPFQKVKAPVKAKEEESKEINTKPLQGIRALLVEDNKFNQVIAKSMLEKWKMIVTLADNGREALENLRKYKFQVVLMDLQMPEMGGLEATRKIRSELKLDIPVIALTANVVKGVIEECISAGMNDYIPKPFDPEVLATKIKILIEQ
jgi:signal transduction histidine kinase/CheY-like chemotaxis protein